MRGGERLQELCRSYLRRLRYIARKHGIGSFVDETIAANKRHECAATEHEVRMLSRLCNDERLMRQEVPEVLGKSYRKCVEDGDFDRIKKLKRVGIYSKISVILIKNS